MRKLLPFPVNCVSKKQIVKNCPRYLSILFCFVAPSLFSAQAGNPLSPACLDEGIWIPDTSWWNVRVGWIEELIFTQRYRSSTRQAISSPALRQHIHCVRLLWNIRERLDLSTQIGFGTVKWHWNEQSQPLWGSTRHSLFWSSTAQLILLQIQHSCLGASVQGGGWTPSHGPSHFAGEASQPSRFSALYWQASIAFSQQWKWLAPYFGVALQQEYIHIKRTGSSTLRLTSRFREGPFGGLSFSNGSYVLFNCEARGWIETALSLSCEIRF